MFRNSAFRIIAILAIICFASHPARSMRQNVERLLTDYVTNMEPWLDIQAGSEQRQPFYVGLSPLEIQLANVEPPAFPSLPWALKSLGESITQQIYTLMIEEHQISDGDTIYLEGWPTMDDYGDADWSFSRYIMDGSTSWIWINVTLPTPDDEFEVLGFVPQPYFTWNDTDFGLIFDDFLQFNDLYAKRVFGDCVWTTESSNEDYTIWGAWLSLEMVDYYKDEVMLAGYRNVCRVIPQPARFNGNPLAFVIPVTSNQTTWPTEIEWYYPVNQSKPDNSTEPSGCLFPSSFNESFAMDIVQLDGQAAAMYPISGRNETFKRKNACQPNNQILDVIEWLEERYALLGIETERQEFYWRDILQSNLIAKIPKTEGDATEAVLLADHIDTAFCQDIFNETGRRVSNPGADDNASATATLLRAAEMFAKQAVTRRHDIWLVHFTGEEFPSDSLGMRHLTSTLLQDSVVVKGLVQLDMIAHTQEKTDTIFQINPADTEKSMGLAEVAFAAYNAIQDQISELTPTLRPFYDPYSYLYNTDGITFQQVGYPVILINEHLNLYQNIDRVGYHDTHDTTKLINWDYGTSVSKVAIETVAQLAGVKC